MTTRIVELRQGILKKNDELAAGLRNRFISARVLVLNLVSSPGSGKTTLLCRTIELLKARLSVTVIEGDSYRVRESERETAARRRKK